MRVIPLAVFCLAGPATAQTGSVPSRIEIVDRPCTCVLSKSRDLDFGDIYRPASGGSVEIYRSGGRSASPTDITADRSYSSGLAGLSADNCDSYTVTRGSWPTALTASGGSLPFSSPSWSVSPTSTNPGNVRSGTTDQGSSLGGEGSSVTRYYFFGGTVSGIGSSTTAARYTATISLSATCS